MTRAFLVFKTGWQSLPTSGRRVLSLYGLGLALLSLIDAIALYAVSNAVSTSSQSGDRLSAAAMVVPIVLFVFRSALATLISFLGMRHFAKYEVDLGKRAFSNINNLNWNEKQTLSPTDYYSAVDRGPSAMVHGILISVVTAVTEVISVAVIIGVILVMQPLTAVTALTYFVAVVLMQHKFLSQSAKDAGENLSNSINNVYQLLNDAASTSKLNSIQPSKTLEIEIEKTRLALAQARANQSFIASLPRYFMEAVLALGFLVVGGVTYLANGADEAFASLAVFAVAGFRLLPSINRIQGLALSILTQVPIAQLIYAVPENLGSLEGKQTYVQETARSWTLRLENISYTYPYKESPAIRNVNLVFEHGRQYAIVGPSGAGKTTLVDVCLGLLEPQSGNVDRRVSAAEIGYVPQETHLVSGTVSMNVAFEWSSDAISKAEVLHALNRAQITDAFSSISPLDYNLGHGGQTLSGGQKQRIGLARALYRNPKFLVLDEATSSLDSTTELEIMKSVNALKPEMTTLIVAHRLSTVRDVDQIIYMQDGEVHGVGTFKELKDSIPEFARQIELGTLG